MGKIWRRVVSKSSKAWLGCGVAGHDDTCLCDVVINEPTPIRVKDAVNEMFMGPQVCQLRGYGRPWTSETMANYFADLCRFYDEWSRDKSGLRRKNTGSRWDATKDIRERMLDLALSGVHYKEVVRIIRDEFGVTYHHTAVYKAINRFRRNSDNDVL